MEDRIPQENEIAALYMQLLEQWNKRNAATMSGLFAPDGSLVGFDGSQLNGQKEIYDVLNEIFSNFPTAAYVAIIKEVRMMTADSGLVRAVVGMVPQGGNDINPAVNAIQSMLDTKENGEWRVALLQNTPAAFHGRPEMSELLSADLRAALSMRN
jgi:uncharacterized protein (TIGR02246 family)